MLCCFTSRLSQPSTESHHAASEGSSAANTPRSNATPSPPSTLTMSTESSAANTPRSNATPSPTLNLSREFAKAVHTSSYNEIWSKIQVIQEWDTVDVSHQQQFLTQVLQPNHEHIQEALQHANTTNPFTQHLLTYFGHTEQIGHLLLILNQKIHHARSLYLPIQELFDVLPGDSNSLTQAECNWAYDIFIQFQDRENPFLCSGSNKFSDMQRCFSDLKEQVDGSLHKSQTKVRMIRCAITVSAICFIGTVVGLAIAAVSIGAHALVALVAGSLLPPFLPKLMKKDLDHIELLDATARSAYVLHNDLQTIDRLVSRLQTAVEDDKFLIRLGVARGRERHPISEVVKRLEKNNGNIKLQLTDLEEHICLCLAAINRARSLLFQLHQSL